jgi:hypothetical protein
MSADIAANPAGHKSYGRWHSVLLAMSTFGFRTTIGHDTRHSVLATRYSVRAQYIASYFVTTHWPSLSSVVTVNNSL